MSVPKLEIRKRLLIDIDVDNIISIKNQLDAYEKYMTEENFNESEEVAELYAKLSDLLIQSM